MKTQCTGPRYDGETLNLASLGGWHGCYGHANALHLDHESDCTSKGQHDRVIAFCPEGKTAYCRIDTLWKLGTPTEKQIISVFKKRNNLRGKWRVVEVSEEYQSGANTDTCYDVTLEKV